MTEFEICGHDEAWCIKRWELSKSIIFIRENPQSQMIEATSRPFSLSLSFYFSTLRCVIVLGCLIFFIIGIYFLNSYGKKL